MSIKIPEPSDNGFLAPGFPGEKVETILENVALFSHFVDPSYLFSLIWSLNCPEFSGAGIYGTASYLRVFRPILGD